MNNRLHRAGALVTGTMLLASVAAIAEDDAALQLPGPNAFTESPIECHTTIDSGFMATAEDHSNDTGFVAKMDDISNDSGFLVLEVDEYHGDGFLQPC
ncbi:MAG: hypothetical protein M3490_00400 [Chloroflexota bacterium]|nr:hypothetical protein [Chloroflexota bacterium]